MEDTSLSMHQMEENFITVIIFQFCKYFIVLEIDKYKQSVTLYFTNSNNI